ncbi:MAG: TonB-dependent receptor [Paludibacter sp.]|nr:TonB-dependent receptor [Paludibacter sp.]
MSKMNEKKFSGNFSLRMFFSLCLIFLFVGEIFAQTKTISGVVKDESGETVIAASVVVKGTSIGTVTNIDGEFKLDVPANAKILVVSYVGMLTQEVTINGSKINVTLKENSKQLEEVVVTGYGTTKKRDLVTSIASVNAEQLKDIPVSTAAEAMQGKLAGVNVVTTEGSPDAQVKIRVRGGSSLTQNSEPLYIVDGFPVSSINDIPPSDIQSMDVLKDAAATAIYGAQGANGVIIITTKDSKSNGNKTTFNVDYTGYVGWKTIAKKYDMLDTRDFVLMQYEYAYLTKGASNLPANFNVYFDQYYQDNGKDANFVTPIADLLDYWGNIEGTDWQDETFGRIGFNSNHNVSLSGGNDIANFNLSYNRIDDIAIMEGSEYSRNNINFKSKFKPVKNLTLGFNSRYSSTGVLGSGTNTADDAGSKTESRVRNAIAYTPIDLLSKDASSLDDEESFGSLYDPLTTIEDNYKNKTDDKWALNGYVSYKFLKNFTFRSDLGYESRHIQTQRFYGPTTYYSREGDGKTFAGGITGTSSAFLINQNTSTLRNSNTLEYKKSFNKTHNLNALIGHEVIINKGQTYTFLGAGYESNFTGKEVFIYPNLATYSNLSNYIDPTDNMLSFFGRVNYDYLGRYYLTGTMRADGSTRFDKSHKSHQWGYFPSLAAAWRVIDEDFMSSSRDWISNLKARLSYGMAGNNNVDLGYLHLDYLSSTSAYMENFSSILTAGGSEKIAANPNIKWETTSTRNLGIDYGFFNERISGAVDLYWNTTNDLIVKYKLPAGYNYQFRNIGSTENKGIEFSVRAVILDKKMKDFSYDLSFGGNISANKNRVTDLGGMDEYPVATGYFSSGYVNADTEYKVEVGESIGRIYGYKTNGWYTTEDFASYNASTDTWLDQDGNKIETIIGTARPGMMKIDSEERTILGNTMPKFSGGFSVEGGFGSTKIGHFDFNANFTYSYGNDVLNLSSIDYSTIYDKSKLRNNTANVAYGKRYSLFKADGTYIPATANAVNGIVSGDDYAQLSNLLDEANKSAVIYNPVSEKIALTDNAVEDGSFLRLSSLTIGYTLPDKLLKSAYITKARIFVTGSNLFCLTNYSGLDPEVDTGSKRNPLAIGVDFSAYPKSRGVNVGVNLSF